MRVWSELEREKAIELVRRAWLKDGSLAPYAWHKKHAIDLQCSLSASLELLREYREQCAFCAHRSASWCDLCKKADQLLGVEGL